MENKTTFKFTEIQQFKDQKNVLKDLTKSFYLQAKLSNMQRSSLPRIQGRRWPERPPESSQRRQQRSDVGRGKYSHTPQPPLAYYYDYSKVGNNVSLPEVPMMA